MTPTGGITSPIPEYPKEPRKAQPLLGKIFFPKSLVLPSPSSSGERPPTALLKRKKTPSINPLSRYPPSHYQTETGQKRLPSPMASGAAGPRNKFPPTVACPLTLAHATGLTWWVQVPRTSAQEAHAPLTPPPAVRSSEICDYGGISMVCRDGKGA